MEIAIIGAGIGGLTTAIALEQKGIDYHIFERFTEVKKIGAGIWLAANALQVFKSLGLLEAIENKGNAINQITIGETDLTPIIENNQESIKAKFGFTVVAIHRAALQEILLDKIPKEKIHFGKSFKSYEIQSNQKIKFSFEDGTNHISDYLIGSDGINSYVRKQLFPHSQIRYSGQTCWRGVAETSLSSDFNHRVYELWGNQIRFGISKISENRYYWFAVALDKAMQKDEPNHLRNKLLSIFSTFDKNVSKLITSTPSDQISRNDISDLKHLSKWHNNKVCLIGDACHATTPNMGQGGAQAIEDAHVISHLLTKHEPEKAFQEFERIRKPKVKFIVNQSWNTGKMAHMKYGTRIRNSLFKLLPTKLIEKRMLDMYSIENFN